MARRKIGRAIARSLLMKSGGACCLCTCPLQISFEKHHVEFFSVSQDDREENLVPIHSDCHAHVHYGLFGAPEDVRRFRDNWFEFWQLLRQVTDAATGGRPEAAARFLVSDSLRNRALVTSSYDRMYVLCNWISAMLPVRTASQRALKANVELMQAEMAYGMGDVQQAYELGQALCRSLSDSQLLSRELNQARLIVAMMAGKMRDFEQEKQLLLQIGADLDTLDDALTSEWAFRFAEFLNQTDKPDDGLRMAQEFFDSHSAIPPRQAAGLLGALGMSQMLEGRLQDAELTLGSALDATISNAHPRGICVRHYAIAEVRLSQGNFDAAIGHALWARWLNPSVGLPVTKQLARLDTKMRSALGINEVDAIHRAILNGKKRFTTAWND
jgi:hypothetical protein